LSAPALSLDELRVRFEAFVCGVYHQRLHGSTGEAPVTRWQKGGFLPAMPDSLDQLDMLLVHVPKPRKVLRDGIRLQGRRYVEPTLAAFVGEKVTVLYDPRDLTEVHVYHGGRFVCRALSPEHLAAPSLRDIQRARRAAKRRDVDEPFIMETGDGDQASPAPRPTTTVRGLRLYAADD
jgi:putative transposase